ncbi:PGAP1-domain-containing protein [Sporormia fimetaria CBS 119925]|uniref:GPI inositol-deacylase n=1 Tax=Sporormia fimetaria CBS 119925 TaxID=1340428 RepID=A0A6A6UVF0_9PLEO|nr:PGAP1-domain-containing protein [Sporormia fimetaria CBS 119925]
MPQRPSGPSEGQDSSDPQVLPATQDHSNVTPQSTTVEPYLLDTIRKREPSSDHDQTHRSVDQRSTPTQPASTPPVRGRHGLPLGPSTQGTASSTIHVPDVDPTYRWRLRSPWSCSLSTALTAVLASALLALMLYSFTTLQLDPKGCDMCYMRPAFVSFPDFDTEHTRFASKYSLYMYREGGIDEDVRVKGVPVLFIPGNAGSYKQARSLGAEAAYYYHNVVRHDPGARNVGKRPLDVFTVDFNEDFTAFHGQTLLDQAEYLNDAITFILSLYHTPERSFRDGNLPDPTSVIIVGHSMGGVVARTMVTMPNFQANSINTILTLAAPHARAPVSFDGDIVRTYGGINHYWKTAYTQKSTNDNPLRDVTLVSIAGGGLDTVVPSDYASIASLVPDTHGFTVFTSSMPNVWTGMDHLAITWCDQVRKSIVQALYDVIDVARPSQTLPRADRMRSFQKWFLTGLEGVAENELAHTELKTRLIVGADQGTILPQGERLVLRSLGNNGHAPKPYLLPIPAAESETRKTFTLLTSESLSSHGATLDVLFCTVSPLHTVQAGVLHQATIDLSGDSTSPTRLACRFSPSDVHLLPASTRHSTFPHKKDAPPFSLLCFDYKDIADHQFVAVIDNSKKRRPGWVVAEFSDSSESSYRVDLGIPRLLATGVDLRLPARRPTMVEFRMPALDSSLLAYKLHVPRTVCDTPELFAPLVRQYVTNVHESKYFVNVTDVEINLHGVAPYMPPSLSGKQSSNGLSMQLWSDPTCNTGLDVSLRIDLLGSIGKLWMRYRIVFAAFPLLVVALVLRQQFKLYDETGVFMSFAESLNQCIGSSIPTTVAGLTLLSVVLAGLRSEAVAGDHHLIEPVRKGLASMLGNEDNELLLGLADTFFWFLVPLFSIMSVGVVVVVNYTLVCITHLFALVFGAMPFLKSRKEGERLPAASGVTSTQQRIIVTCILLSLVSTVVPYHFAYVVLCLVQIGTCICSCRTARDSRIEASYNFYNYVHSTLVLLIWILPINIPVLIVWVRNLTVRWLTPFSSHHNILSILPLMVLVETQTTGRMVPPARLHLGFLTNALLFGFAAYAAVYGVSYAYVLHQLANGFAAWLVALHFDASSLSVKQFSTILDNNALFNSALRQSTSLRKDLDQFADSASPTPALQGQISASLTSFSRTIDDYGKLAKQEPVATKQEKAFERLKAFRAELNDYREQFQRIRSVNEEMQTTASRTELLGRRPHHASTPENPYALPTNNHTPNYNSPFAPSQPRDPNAPYRPNAYSTLSSPYASQGDYTRESHAFREQSFLAQTSTQLDEFLDRGRNVLGDLGHQREILKGTQRRLYSVANTLGISGDTIRMVERRAKQDKWIFWAGVVIFVLFCWAVLHFLR